MGGEKRILVVDDDDAIRSLVYTVLRRRGLKIDTARNGVEALERCTRCHYAIVLLDLMMPRLSGWEVLDALRRFAVDTRPLVIVLTAGNEPRNLDPELVAGTVRKPFDIELLVDMVMGCLKMLGERAQSGDCPPSESDSPETRQTSSSDDPN